MLESPAGWERNGIQKEAIKQHIQTRGIHWRLMCYRLIHLSSTSLNETRSISVPSYKQVHRNSLPPSMPDPTLFNIIGQTEVVVVVVVVLMVMVVVVVVVVGVVIVR